VDATPPAPEVPAACSEGATTVGAQEVQVAGEAGAKQCTCPVGYAISDFNATGKMSDTGKRCFLCPFNQYVAVASPGVCTPCPDPYMTRDLASGLCRCRADMIEDSTLVAGAAVADIPFVGSHVCLDRALASSIGVTAAAYGEHVFKDVIDVDGSRTERVPVAKSVPFVRHFLEAAVRCQNARRWQSCQALANLCTLSLHDSTTPACKILSDYTAAVTTNEQVHGFAGWVPGYPWMTYDAAARDVIKATGINRQVALTGPLSLINLTLSVYALNGTYLGLEDVSTQLHMCAGDSRTLERFRTFGSNTLVSCQIDLMHLVTRTDEPRFYELWMDDKYDKLGKLRAEGTVLYPLPVIISNYEEGGRRPNKILTDQKSLQLGVGLDGAAALDKVKLHRRFFLWDNVSGKKLPDASKARAGQELPTVVRWAKYVELRITLQTDDPDTLNVDESVRMYPPHLIIEYDQQMVSTVPREVAARRQAASSGSSASTGSGAAGSATTGAGATGSGGSGAAGSGASGSASSMALTGPPDMRYPAVSFQSTYTMELVRFWQVRSPAYSV